LNEQTTKRGDQDGSGIIARFNSPKGIASHRNHIFIVDSGNHKIKLYQPDKDFVQTLCGSSQGLLDGFGTNSKFNFPHSIAISSNGEFALVTDSGNNILRKIILLTNEVMTIAGSLQGSSGYLDGFDLGSLFSLPLGVCLLLMILLSSQTRGITSFVASN
jgi:hypothetical protein